MKIVAISDTHGCLPEIPKCDLFIHCGDICYDNPPSVQSNFINYHFIPWINDIDADKKVFIAGNHDFVFQQMHMLINFKSLNSNVVYLEDRSLRYNNYTIYGSPWTPRFGNWAFMRKDYDITYPNYHIDVLITHGPPFGVLDRNNDGQNCGSKSLLKRSEEKDIKLHCFGHIHEARGIDNKYINCSYLDRDYVRKRDPLIVEKLE